MDKESPDRNERLIQVETKVGRMEKEGEFGGGVVYRIGVKGVKKKVEENGSEMETGDGKQDNPEVVQKNG